MVYVNDKPIFTVCDSTVFVKIKDELKELMQNTDKGFPYEGAKEQYILDIENKALAIEAAIILEAITPLPKKRK